MKAAVLTRYGAKLAIRRQDIPKLSADEVLLRMKYSPVNPSDLYFLKGIYGDKKTLPVIPGFEGLFIVIRGWSSRRLWKR